MWVFTPGGFVSAVALNDGTDTLAVRARDEESLFSLASLADVEIVRTPRRDYMYRVHVPRATYVEWLMTEADNLTYTNYKDEAMRTRGYEWAGPLHNVWAAMLEITYEEKRQKHSRMKEASA